MSSIGAIYHRDGRAIAPEDIQRMAESLNHGHAVDVKVFVRKNFGCVICKQIFVPEDTYDEQPEFLADRQSCVVFDGRIDNRSELGASLGLKPNEYQNFADSRLFAHAFENWGESCTDRIVGEFAAIIYSYVTDTLLLIRDHLGHRSLLYHESNSTIAAATEPSALFAMQWIECETNWEDLADLMIGKHTNPENSPYRNIYYVPPAGIVRSIKSEIRHTVYWDPLDAPAVEYKEDSDYVDAFIEVFDTAVLAQLRSTGKVGSTLSGGFDSSSVASSAARILGDRELPTFTSVPDAGFNQPDTRGRCFNEQPAVNTIADRIPNINPAFVATCEGSITETIRRSTARYQAPLANVLNMSWHNAILNKALENNCTVLLDGEGGNDTISYNGYGLPRQRFLRGQWFALVKELRPFPKYMRRWLIRQLLVAHYTPSLVLSLRRRLQGRQATHGEYTGPLTKEQFRRMASKPKYGRSSSLFTDFTGMSARAERAYRLSARHGGSTFRAIDRTKLAIDQRSPALDRRVVEFTLGIPESQFFTAGWDKWLVRRAMKDRLPATVLANRKTGIQSADWFTILSRETSKMLEIVNDAKDDNELNSILRMQDMIELIAHWPDEAPPIGSFEETQLFNIVPKAIAAIEFVQFSKSLR